MTLTRMLLLTVASLGLGACSTSKRRMACQKSLTQGAEGRVTDANATCL